MTPDELSRAIQAKLHPATYKYSLASGPFDFLFLRSSFLGGRYGFAFCRLGTESIRETYQRSRAAARHLTRATWLLREVGLYLVFCGPRSQWQPYIEDAPVDRTGLHHIIVQAVHFIDPETGANHLSESAWGPVKFGTAIPVAEMVLEAIERVRDFPADAGERDAFN